MPFKDFRKDLKDAGGPDRYPHLSGIRAGDNDGSISFTFTSPASNEPIKLEAIVSDAHDYPKTHNFFVFFTSEEVSASVIKTLEEAQSRFEGVNIHKFLTSVDRVISDALHAPSHQKTEVEDNETEHEYDSSDGEIDEDGEFSDLETETPQFFPLPSQSAKLQEKLRRDLRAVKAAGYKVGYLGDMTGAITITVSCRIARLDLSEEAMQTWDVRPDEYLVVLIRYTRAYQGLQDVMDLGDAAQSFLQLRVGLCDSYKPSNEAVLHAFRAPSLVQQETSVSSNLHTKTSFRTFFIGDPLNKLLNERFLGIVKLRQAHHFSWTGAECCFQDSQGMITGENDTDSPYNVEDVWQTPAPALLVSDHLVNTNFMLAKTSLPLLAMQFTLRHFAKCTEFCLVCHCRTGDNFEALKPYVCSKGLCLYQYIALGMGPSLEYEIRSQPYVVDMLISLAYSRACAQDLQDFPTGLGLRVPDIRRSQDEGKPQPSPNSSPNVPKYRKGNLSTSADSTELLLTHDGTARLMIGDWVLILDADSSAQNVGRKSWHCRVKNIWESSIHITLSLPIHNHAQLLPADVHSFVPKEKGVRYLIYDQNFDDLPVHQKQNTLVALLDILPGIDEMTSYLGHASSDKLLSSWRDRMSPALVDLLRWIVSSNRSCILQDNNTPEHLVAGMNGYVQFRLVQGAPDKEQRFVQAVEAMTEPAKSEYPTIFAWHGSALKNWHAILRQGLNYEKVVNGRAYGNGVYFSSSFQTSAQYTSNLGMRSADYWCWPQSKLRVGSMVSLNEIVNCTSEFAATKPHYVVTQLDWIQPRYLFVATNSEIAKAEPASATFYKQDPKHLARGPDGLGINIPISAISSSRRFRPPSADAATEAGSGRIEDLDDNMSDSTMIEDLLVLLSESESEDDLERQSPSQLDMEAGEDNTNESTTEAKSTATDFVPGTLQVNSLPLLESPRYATTIATKLLQQHLQATLKVQKREKLHELGWYVNSSLITTVYQWIVELHSFDPALPLAKDLKSANLTSIVLEMRFPSQFPINPPFVRIIRPRFLSFAHGGGGHVTAGGAICMELLTNSGWSPVASIESVLLQIRMAITSTDPHPARLAKGVNAGNYQVGEAVEAYKRACLAHGWKVPPEMEQISW